MTDQDDLEAYIDSEGQKSNPKPARPHYHKLQNALNNDNMGDDDLELLRSFIDSYEDMNTQIEDISVGGKEKVVKITDLYNEYKNEVAIRTLSESGQHLLRSKGQLKIESSITEELLVELIDSDIIPALDRAGDYVTGPHKSLLSIDFVPENISEVGNTSSINIETKDQDFVFGSNIHYKLSTDETFNESESGDFTFSVIATECKRHLDKTMYREQLGTARELKQLVPFSRYYVITDFLDMTPQNAKRTELDNVYVLRKAKRLPSGSRKDIDILSEHLDANPMDPDVVWDYVREISDFLDSQWYDPDEVLDRGSFI